MEKTRDYDKFKLRPDNRKIEPSHVEKLIRSMKARNLLEWQPITVDKNLVVIDGQHRLAAARTLGLQIYYKIITDSKPEDIMMLNINKSWNLSDYLNYFIANREPEYLKLSDYMKVNQLTLKLALNLTCGRKFEQTEFKLGRFKFEGENSQQTLDICHSTIDFIRKMNGFSSYTNTVRFWLALTKLINHGNFNMEKWLFNLTRMVHKFGPRATCKDYEDMFMNCFNWKNGTKIELDE